MTDAELAKARESMLIDDSLALLAVESPSSDIPSLERSADAIDALFERRLGHTAERIVVEGRPHLLLGFGDEVRVVILCHHDTVWPLGTLDRIPARVEEGLLRGPGAVDMKAGIVVAVHALAILAEREGVAALRGVAVLVTADEETGSASSRELIESVARGAEAVLVLEGGGDRGEVKVERKGVSQYLVTAVGKAAHAGIEPDRGANATVAIAEAILALAALHASAEGLSVVPGVVQGGTTANTVPALASVTVDVRARDAATQLAVHERILALETSVRGASLQVTGGVNRQPLEASASAWLYERIQHVSPRAGIETPGSIAVGGGSDGNFTAALGVPTIDGLGPWGGGAHAENERAEIASLPARTALLAALVADLLAGGGRATDDQARAALTRDQRDETVDGSSL